ncbi:hypothetical protein BJV78DRAFT_1233833 [Lactifluus subvellereus]|nr:hypothetical protein BJV78DRAFT_1233833 [Lactifluus subvellereus]
MIKLILCYVGCLPTRTKIDFKTQTGLGGTTTRALDLFTVKRSRRPLPMPCGHDVGEVQ